MNKMLSLAAIAAIGLATGAAAQNARSGYWKLPGTTFGGFFNQRSLQPDGTVRGDNPAVVAAGAVAVVVYEFSIYNNPDLKPGLDMCRQIEAELVKNEKSLLRYFDKVPAGALKPIAFSAAVHSHYMKPPRTLVITPIGGNVNGHTRCYLSSTKDDRPFQFFVLGTYRI